MKYQIELDEKELGILTNTMDAWRGGPQALFMNGSFEKVEDTFTLDEVNQSINNALDRAGKALVRVYQTYDSGMKAQAFGTYAATLDMVKSRGLVRFLQEIEEYEHNTEEEANKPLTIGDEVIYEDKTYIVTRITECNVFTMDSEGRVDIWCADANLVRTGNHYDKFKQLLAELEAAQCSK